MEAYTDIGAKHSLMVAKSDQDQNARAKGQGPGTTGGE